MAIENIQDGWHGHTKKEVREALQEKLRELEEQGGNSVDVYDGLDSTDPEKALSARQGKKLKEEVDNKPSLMGATGRIDHSKAAAVVLASMGSDLDGGGGYRPSVGDYYATGTSVKYMESEDNIVNMSPDERLIYCNARTDKLYRWVATGEVGWKEVGEDEARATIMATLGMLESSQWPRVVIETLTPTDNPDEMANGLLYVFKPISTVDYWNALCVKIGNTVIKFAPSRHAIYCVKDEAALYLYTGTHFEPMDYYRKDEVYDKAETEQYVQEYVQQHGGGGGGNVSINGTSLVLGGSSNNEDAPNVNPGGDPGVLHVYHVKASDHEITEGMMYKDANGHYSSDQYEKMYKNATGFTNAIMYAYQHGYSKVVFQRGDYCFTPIFNVGGEAVDLLGSPVCIWMLNMSDLEIDMNGSTFHLLVDSTAHSSYYRVNSPSYSYYSTVIGIGQSKNITIRNGNFRGDLYSRSYNVSNNELKQEGCYGITVGVSAFTHNISLLDLDGSGFSGDFIKTQPRTLYVFKEPFWTGLHNDYNPNCRRMPATTVKGVMNFGYGFDYNASYNIAVSNNGSNKYGLSGVHDIGNWMTGDDWGDYEYVLKEVSRREFSLFTPGDSIRLANCYAPLIHVLTYADYPSTPDTAPLRIVKTGYCESFQLFENERYVRLQFLYENGLSTGQYRSTGLDDLSAVNEYFGTDFAAGETNSPNQSPDAEDDIPDLDDETIFYSGGNNAEVALSDAGGAGPRIAIVKKLNEMVLIEGCRIHDNGRGGIEGGANNVVIRRCEFMKQQYMNTASAQGSHPVYSVKGTNYHIDYEDHVSNHVTIEHCVFYSGKSTGKLLFPTVMRFDFRDNICYGCAPCIGNNFITNIEGNTFHGTSISPYYPWLSGTQCHSRAKMLRVMNYENNVYYNCSSPGYGVLTNTMQRIRNCLIEINSDYSVEFESQQTFMDAAGKPDKLFEGCTIRFMSPNTTAYFPYLKVCRIFGGNNWKVGHIEDCVLENSAFAIIGNFAEAVDGNYSEEADGVLHLYVKNTRGLDLLSHCHPPLSIHRHGYSDDDIRDPKLDYVVHYEGCEIDVSNVFEQLLAYTKISNPARWYNGIILEFKNCRFIGSASNTSLEGNGDSHYSKVLFEGCEFDVDTAYLFGGTVQKTNRYFEFAGCRFRQEGFKLGIGEYALVCGGEYGGSANRPMLTRAGSVYFDTGEGKPIWRSSGALSLAEISNVEFVDASGATA